MLKSFANKSSLSMLETENNWAAGECNTLGSDQQRMLARWQIIPDQCAHVKCIKPCLPRGQNTQCNYTELVQCKNRAKALWVRREKEEETNRKLNLAQRKAAPSLSRWPQLWTMLTYWETIERRIYWTQCVTLATQSNFCYFYSFNDILISITFF